MKFKKKCAPAGAGKDEETRAKNWPEPVPPHGLEFLIEPVRENFSDSKLKEILAEEDIFEDDHGMCIELVQKYVVDYDRYSTIIIYSFVVLIKTFLCRFVIIRGYY